MTGPFASNVQAAAPWRAVPYLVTYSDGSTAIVPNTAVVLVDGPNYEFHADWAAAGQPHTTLPIVDGDRHIVSAEPAPRDAEATVVPVNAYTVQTAADVLAVGAAELAAEQEAVRAEVETVRADLDEAIEGALNSPAGNTIWRQASAPTGDNRVGDLWLQTPGNVVHRWEGDPGSWVEVADQRIAQAIDDAFAAQQAAAAAQQKGVDALAAAGTAQSTATGAATAAASKATVFAQTSAPTTTGRATGDIWLDTDDGNRRYVWTGSWTASPIGAAGISATARQLGAITTYRQATAPTTGMVVGDFWIDSDDNVIYRYEGTTPTWVKSQDTNINAAITAAATAQSTADGKMRIFPQTTAPAGLTAGDVGDMWIDTDDANRTYTWALISGSAYGWQPRLLGSNAIQPNSLVARDVVATGTVSAALLETLMVLTNTLVVGNPAGDRVTIGNPAGGGVGIQQVTGGKVRFNLSPAGDPYFAGTLTGFSANFQEGSTGWALTEGGDFSAQNGQFFENLTAQALSVSTLTVAGQPISNMIASRPGGLIAQGFEPTLSLQGKIAETGIVELGFTAQPGRGYHININGPGFAASDQNTTIGFLLRGTLDGSAPNVGSPLIQALGHEFAGPTDVGVYPVRSLHRTLLWYPVAATDTAKTVRLALSFYREAGAGTVGVNCSQIRAQMFVLDAGPALPNSMRVNNFTAAAPPPPPAPPVQAYEETFETTWTCSYRGGSGTAWSLNDRMYQGYADSFNGNQSSLMGFDLALLRSRLAGANIKWAKLYARAQHTYNSAGAYAWIGSHGNDAVPGHGNAIVVAQPRRSFVSVAPGGWLEQDVTGIVTEMRNAQASGLMFGPAPDNSTAHYAYFYGQNVPNRPRLVVRWEK